MSGARKAGSGVSTALTDEGYLASCLDVGDLHRAATGALRMYGPAILKYLRSILGEDEAAYEVFSEFSEDLWKALRRFRREASVRSWTYKLAWTAAQDWKRRAARHPVQRLGTDEMSEIVAEIRSTTPLHERADAKDRWNELKAALGTEDRSLLVLRVEQRLSWREIADVMATRGDPLDAATLRKRFERLKSRLHELAAKHGLSAER